MIEIIYNKEKEKATGNEEYFCIPRNIRQIGETSKEYKIYLEDYVHTYLTADWKEDEPKEKVAILLGRCNWKQGITYVFIKSAVSVDDVSISKDQYTLTDTQWGCVYETMKQYFPGQEVVGWYLSFPDSGLKVSDGILRTHLKHFGGNDKVLFLADPGERESAFFLYHNNGMEKQPGYYLFYEKNDSMQEYMLMRNPETVMDYSGKAQDRAIKDFRKIIERKQNEKAEKEKGMSWGAVACMGIIALSLAAGAAWITVNRESSTGENAPASQKVTSIMEETHFVNGSVPETDMEKEVQKAVDEETAQEIEEDGMVLLTPEAPKEENQPLDDEDGVFEEEQQTTVNVYTKYTVRNGDTLSKISLRYYGDFSKIKEICKINNLLEEDVIYPGQTILLP